MSNRDIKTLPGAGTERKMKNYCLIGKQFQFGKIEKFWRWIVAMVAHQCQCT